MGAGIVSFDDDSTGPGTVNGAMFNVLNGESPIMILAGVLKMGDAVGEPSFLRTSTGFNGVAKMVLRATPESNALSFGAFEGVSAMPENVKSRPVALRATVPGTISDR